MSELFLSCGLREDIQCGCDDKRNSLRVGLVTPFSLIQQPEQGPAHAAGAVRPDRIGGDALEALGQHADKVQVGSLGWHEKSAGVALKRAFAQDGQNDRNDQNP